MTFSEISLRRALVHSQEQSSRLVHLMSQMCAQYTDYYYGLLDVFVVWFPQYLHVMDNTVRIFSLSSALLFLRWMALHGDKGTEFTTYSNVHVRAQYLHRSV